MNVARFVFPGFEYVRRGDTSSHEVEIGKLTVGSDTFIVHLIRKGDLPFEASFLLAKVFNANEKKLLWSFPKDFCGLGLLADASDDIVIALVGKGQAGKVENVVPFSSFSNPSDLRRKIALKERAAKYLERDYVLTQIEEKIRKRDIEERLKQEQANREAAYQERQRARMERVDRIIGRGTVTVYTLDGGKRFGFPVVGDEWHSLEGGNRVVLVESYNDETKQMGIPIEAFIVYKGRGKTPEKRQGASVSLTGGASQKGNVPANLPRPSQTVALEISGRGAFEVGVYATMDEIRLARAHGLNNGSLVTAADKKVGDRYEVFSVHTEGIKTIGLCAPIV